MQKEVEHLKVIDIIIITVIILEVVFLGAFVVYNKVLKEEPDMIIREGYEPDFEPETEPTEKEEEKKSVKSKITRISRKTFVPEDRPSPFDHVKESEIKVFKNEVKINIKNVVWSKFTATHSMDPLLDVGANGLHIIPETKEQLHVGDIVSYNPSIPGYEKTIIIHRIIEIGNDKKGWYAIIKGDNLPKPDPGKVRFEQIKRVLIGVIY